jgi:hypothetical protein
MKKISRFILLLILLLTLTGCVEHIEDTNGADNFSLETITDQDILNGFPTISVRQSKVRKNNEYKYSVKKITGVEEVFKGSFKNENVAITINTSVEEGNARIVLVYKNQIIKQFMLNADNQVFSMINVDGEIKIIVAGESAKINIDFIVESEKSIS